MHTLSAGGAAWAPGPSFPPSALACWSVTQDKRTALLVDIAGRHEQVDIAGRAIGPQARQGAGRRGDIDVNVSPAGAARYSASISGHPGKGLLLIQDTN